MIRTIQIGSHHYAQGLLVLGPTPSGMAVIELAGGKMLRGKLVPQIVMVS